CARAASNAGLGKWTVVGERAWQGTVILAAATDCTLGKSAWRIRLRPRSSLCVRNRRAMELRSLATQETGAALVSFWHRKLGSVLRHPLRMGIDSRCAQDSRSRRAAAFDHRMAPLGFQQARRVRDCDSRLDRRRALLRGEAAAAADRTGSWLAAHGPGTCQER